VAAGSSLVANDDVLRTDHLLAGLVRARGTTGVQHDLMLLIDQKVGGHLSEAVSGAGDEDARHHESFRLSPAILPVQCTKKDSQDGGDNELGHLAAGLVCGPRWWKAFAIRPNSLELGHFFGTNCRYTQPKSVVRKTLILLPFFEGPGEWLRVPASPPPNRDVRKTQ
jgi:hypothetical protein